MKRIYKSPSLRARPPFSKWVFGAKRHFALRAAPFTSRECGITKWAFYASRFFTSIFFILTLTNQSVLAATSKLAPNTPIQIQADKASIDQMHRQATHEGNVVLTQGAHVLHADKLITKQDASGHLSVIIATGKPASFEGRLETSPHPVYATAKTIYYYPDKQLVVLEGSATLNHQQDKFEGPSLSYQLDTQVMSATRKSNERPIFTLHPRSQDRS